jgi:hypothetical protein
MCRQRSESLRSFGTTASRDGVGTHLFLDDRISTSLGSGWQYLSTVAFGTCVRGAIAIRRQLAVNSGAKNSWRIEVETHACDDNFTRTVSAR